MPVQQSRSKANLLVAELNTLQEGIRRLEEKRLALEDNIIGVIFSPPSEPVAQPATTTLSEFPESLPIRRLSAECPHYFGWNLVAEEHRVEDSERGCLPFADPDGHLIAATIGPAFHYPMADLVVVLHPDLKQDNAVRLIMKLGSLIREAGVHQGPAKLHTGQEIPASLFLQASVSAQNSAGLKTVPPRFEAERPSPGGRPSGRLLEVFNGCLTAIDSHFVALAEGTQESLQQDLHTLRTEVEHLTGEISEQESLCSAAKASCEQLSEAMGMLREVESTNVERLDALQVEADTLAGSDESLSLQMRKQQDDLKALRSAIDKVVERLDRQAEMIRSLHRIQMQLASSLLAL